MRVSPELKSPLNAKSYKIWLGKSIIYWSFLIVHNAQMYIPHSVNQKVSNVFQIGKRFDNGLLFENWEGYCTMMGFFPLKYDFGYLKVLIKEVDHRHLHHHFHHTTSSFLPFFPLLLLTSSLRTLSTIPSKNPSFAPTQVFESHKIPFSFLINSLKSLLFLLKCVYIIIFFCMLSTSWILAYINTPK